MKNWVITGGAGSGKSLFSKVIGDLHRRLIVVFSCDQAAKQLWGDPDFKDRLRSEFAVEIERHQFAELNPAFMRKLIFGDSRARKRLEDIMHPLILALLESRQDEIERQGKAKVFLAEVPLYYEAHFSMPADKVIVVAASQTVQRTRLMEYRFLDAEIVEGMLNAQLTLEPKINKADVVVWNDGSQSMLESQAQLLVRDC